MGWDYPPGVTGNEPQIAGTDSGCDCTHDERHHDPISGACLYTNPTFGPCPCAATHDDTRAALWAAHRTLKELQK